MTEDERRRSTRRHVPAEARDPALRVIVVAGETLDLALREAVVETVAPDRFLNQGAGGADVVVLDTPPDAWPALARKARSNDSDALPIVLVTERRVPAGKTPRQFGILSGDSRAAERMLRPLGALVTRIRALTQQLAETRVREQAGNQANEEAVHLLLELDERDRIIGEQNRRIEEQMGRIKHDLDYAAKVQMALLPKEPPVFGFFRFASLYKSAEELCGDYYDFLRPSEDTMDLVVADVAGHGVASALVGVQVRTMLHAAVHTSETVPQILVRINDTLERAFGGNPFVTLFHARFRKGEDSVEYASAGHNPGLLLRVGNDEPEELESTGMPLGFLLGADVQTNRVKFRPGDRLLVYTDGLFEPVNEQREQFGMKAVKTIFSDMRGEPRESVVERLADAVTKHAQGRLPDDLTAVLVEYVP